LTAASLCYPPLVAPTVPRSPDPALVARWNLDPSITFLNHGSFGAAPRAVLEAQAGMRTRLEAEPVRFFIREYEALLDAARRRLAGFLDADPEQLVFVPNATTGVNTALASLDLAPGDELLVSDHEYPACRNAVEATAARTGARVVIMRIPFPLDGASQAVDATLGAVTPRTRAALVDHVTSQTGLVLPAAEIIAALKQRGITVIIDGAHAPGMLELDLKGLGADLYTGNLHKWVCAPKGAAFLFVREPDRRAVRPLVISHGASASTQARSRYWLEHDWTGTFDPTAWLSVPAALDEVGGMLPGGWPQVRASNRALALAARRVVADRLGVAAPCPDDMIGSLATLLLPDGESVRRDIDPLQDALWEQHRIEVPVIPWPAPPRRLLRLSAQLYNGLDQYERLADALAELLR
jgi:isopenicillin-N epimerase